MAPSNPSATAEQAVDAGGVVPMHAGEEAASSPAGLSPPGFVDGIARERPSHAGSERAMEPSVPPPSAEDETVAAAQVSTVDEERST